MINYLARLIFACCVIIASLYLIFEAPWYYKLYKSRKIEDDIWLRPYANTIIKSKYKIVIITSKALGDKSWGEVIKQSAEKMGWKAKTFEHLDVHEDEINEFKPDFIISTSYNADMKIPDSIDCKKYMYLSQNLAKYIKKPINKIHAKFQEKDFKYKNAFKADAFICSFKEISVFKDVFQSLTHRKFHGFRSFPYSYPTKFAPPKLNNLCYFGTNWDKLRRSEKYKDLFRTLNANGYLVVYGPESAWQHVKDAWGGEVKPAEIAVKIHEAGIVLNLHSQKHLNGGIGTLRTVESAAAGAVIISDLNPFVINVFGDSVLYVDQTKSAQEMADEVDRHVKWVMDNKEKATQLAKRSHEIFLEKLNMEQELIRIAKMHETIIAEESVQH